MAPPQGTVTFVFTDIVGSTRLWEQHPAVMGEAVRRHDDMLRNLFTSHGGYIFKTVGDAFCVAFAEPHAALTAAGDVQRRLAAEPWGDIGALTVRIGVHTGTAESRGNDYFGGTLNRVARIEAAAHASQVLVSGVTRELVRDNLPGGLGLRALGEHRLKSLDRPEQLFQLTGEDLPSDFPPPRSMSVLPNNLPSQSTSFIGRTSELEAITRQLSGTTRLLTLTGTGGTGKTRLAMEAGAAMTGLFPGGVWLVELALITDAERVPSAIIASLDLREEPGRSARETLLEVLRRQEMLLILDNCEHLIRPVASLVADFLKASPKPRILATSRSALGISGETTLPVPPLGIFDLHRQPLDDPDFARRLAESDAVRLFVERAKAVRPDFVLDATNAAAVAEICSRLDGIPLALELAAARLRLLDAKQIASRLADRFRLLRTSDQERLPHQQTLQALVDWSHDLLTEQEQILFRRLAVFAGGRTLEAIETVCPCETLDEADILDVLHGLVEKSLINVETGESSEQRYTMIESVWHYARARLQDSGEEDRLRDAHARYFLEWAEQAEPHFSKSDQALWLAKFDDDLFNLDTAIRWFISRDAASEAMRLLAAVGRPMETRGYLTQGLGLVQSLLDLPAEAPPALRARTEFAAGRFCWALDRYDAARKHFHESERLASLAGDNKLATSCIIFLGFLNRDNGQVEDAEASFLRGLEQARADRNQVAEALALGGLSRVEADRGHLDESRRLCEAALAIHRTLGDHYVIGFVLWGLARTAIAQGDITAAENALREWAGISASLRSQWVMPYLLQTLASAACADGRFERAARLLGAAEAQRDRFGFRLSVTEQADLEADLARITAALPPEQITALRYEGRDINLHNIWMVE